MTEKAKDDGPTSFVAKDFVYAGRRILTNGKMAAQILEIENGLLGNLSHYDYKYMKSKAIGGIYQGATFSSGTVRGLDDAKYQGLWADETARIDWRSRDESAESTLRNAKMEADAKRTNEIEELLLPLRKLYASYAQRNDYAGKEALEAALVRALRRRPPKTA